MAIPSFRSSCNTRFSRRRRCSRTSTSTGTSRRMTDQRISPTTRPSMIRRRVGSTEPGRPNDRRTSPRTNPGPGFGLCRPSRCCRRRRRQRLSRRRSITTITTTTPRVTGSSTGRPVQTGRGRPRQIPTAEGRPGPTGSCRRHHLLSLKSHLCVSSNAEPNHLEFMS